MQIKRTTYLIAHKHLLLLRNLSPLEVHRVYHLLLRVLFQYQYHPVVLQVSACIPQTFQATLARRKRIHHWLITHPEFLRDMDHTAFDFAKGMYGPDEVFNAGVVKELLKDHGITVDFTPMEILSVWEKGADYVE